MLVFRSPRRLLLAPFVQSLWVCRLEGPDLFERVLPNGRMQVLVNLFEDELREYDVDGDCRATRGAVLQGPRTRSTILDTREQRWICGVSFAHAGPSRFFAPPASELTESAIPLASLWGRDGAVLRERLIEAREPVAQLDLLEEALVARARDPRAPDVRLARARDMLSAGASVETAGSRVGFSAHALIERFLETTGMTPKLFARVERFQRLVQSIDRMRSWSDLALSSGYADQAHMIREFKHFSGMTPARYRGRTDAPNHAAYDERQNYSIRRA